MWKVVVLVAMGSSASAAPLVAVRSDGDQVCAVRAGGAVACNDKLAYPRADLPLRDLQLRQDVVVKLDGTLAEIDPFERKVSAIAVPFKVRAAGVYGTGDRWLCALGERGELACAAWKPGTAKLDAKPLPGRFVDLRVDGLDMFALDDRGALWCGGGATCARFAMAGKASTLLGYAARWPKPLDEPKQTVAPFHVADGVTAILDGGGCLADAQGLVCANFAQAPHRVARPAGDEVVIARMMMCARAGAKVTCQLVPSGHDDPELAPLETAPTTFEIKGAVKLHGGDQLCVETSHDELRCVRASNPMTAPTAVSWAPRS